MGSAITALSSLQSGYDFDRSNPGIVIEMYLNDSLDDCVVAARAHHTIRLTYIPGTPVMSISPEEITTEYTKEVVGGTGGIDLQASLLEWEMGGWKAGGVSGRKIQGRSGPFSVNGAGMALGDPTNDWSRSQLMTAIVEDTGVQAQLRIPPQIRVDDKTSYGIDHPWVDTTQPRFWPHVILLTGYDNNGPIGITWGTKQRMTWQFLEQYCLGVFTVEKGANT